MKPEIIKAIFTNLLFVIGVVLLIFGFIRGSLTVVRLFTFDKYPLASYEEMRCDNQFGGVMYQPDGKEVVVDKAQQEEQKAKCEENLNYSRKVAQVEHIVTAITTLVAGSVLVLSFKRFIFGWYLFHSRLSFWSKVIKYYQYEIVPHYPS